MKTPTDWAWNVPLPPESSSTRVVLLALAEFSAPILPGTDTVRLGVVDTSHPAIAQTANMTRDEVARHVAALTRADVLIPAPESTLVRFNEAVTESSTTVADVVAQTLDVLPATVPTTPVEITPHGDDAAAQDALIDVQPAPPPKKARKTKPRRSTPEDDAAKSVLAWWWEHWTSNVGPVSNGPAFSAHAKRVAAAMLAEGYSVDAIKEAFIAVDEPRPAEFAVRNRLRGKHRGTSTESAANHGAHTPRKANNPFASLAGVSR